MTFSECPICKKNVKGSFPTFHKKCFKNSTKGKRIKALQAAAISYCPGRLPFPPDYAARMADEVED